MSSLIGHLATGAAIAFAGKDLPAAPAPGRLLLLTLLAIIPDADYLGYGLLGVDAQPRLTHSLAFCLGIACTAWTLMRIPGRRDRVSIGFVTLALATCSHLLLDLLVGVHSLPLFWPFVADGISSPIGLLPSAAHASLTNYYLWRNTFIEAGVLLPVLAVIVALRRRVDFASVRRNAFLILPLWIACLTWSIGLPR